jgi:hypothetical protein
VTVGPSLVIVPELRIDFRRAVAEKVAESPSGGWDVDLRSGLAWKFSSGVALFAETGTSDTRWASRKRHA